MACEEALRIIDGWGDTVGPAGDPEALGPQPDNVHVIARIPGTGDAEPLLLLGHSDVVPVEEENWDVDPFAGEIVDGEIYGRGALDMKGANSAFISAMLRHLDEGAEFDRDIIVLTDCDEEAGSFGSRWLAANHWDKLDAVIKKVEAARAEGLKITADMYTYTAGATGLTACLPPWTAADGRLFENLADSAVRETERLLKDIFREPDAVASAVDQSKLAERTLKRRFKAATGLTILEYVQNLRIEEAKQLLETTGEPTDTEPTDTTEGPASSDLTVGPERMLAE